ncbi:hypothetical protein C2S51_036526 [Perilla frutescens var. frutescens]|nr:hypothetical protein C2S51_036526 [Perilla frutescens var. frutescens]
MNCRRAARSTGAPPPSFEAVQSKLSRVVCRHEQLKVSFDELRSQIGTGLLEAEDVFVSLAVQLMKLVGLKTAEMAEERRFSTIVTSFDCSQSQPEVDYMKKAIKAGNELMERQKLQLVQLITLLKNIEAQVNSSQKSIFQDLANHQACIRKLFLKASSYVSSVHQSGRSNDLSRTMLLILKATFDQVGAAFGSVEVGIDDLIKELSDKMCNPMVQYANGLKVEIQRGTSSCLLEVVKEMHEAMQARRYELDEARNQTWLAEQSRIEAVSRLMKSEETAKKLTISLGLLIEDTIGLYEKEKSSRVGQDQAKDDSLMWELLRQKRKSLSDSPLGPNELLGIGTSGKKLPSKRVIPLLTHRPPKRSQLKGLDLESSSINSRMLLGSSPSTTTQKVLCGKRITP